MGLDIKIYWLTDRLSFCDSNPDLKLVEGRQLWQFSCEIVVSQQQH
jgi:hypothetical protein